MANLGNITPSSEVQEQLIGHIVDWAQNVFGYSNEEIAEKVIHVARSPITAPRDTLPIIAYFFSMLDLPLGMDEYVEYEDGYGITGGRMATLSFVGFGEGSHEMLTRLALCAIPEFTPDDITISNLSPIVDISEFDETHIEYRCAKDFAVQYRVTSDSIIPITKALSVNGEEI